MYLDQCCGAGAGARAAIFRAVPEPEPIICSVGAESRSRFFKAAPAPSFRKAKVNLVQFIQINMPQNRIEQINFFRAQNDRF